jgi:hypothetical protein
LSFQPLTWTLNTCPDSNVSLPKTFVVTDVLITNRCEHLHSFTLAYFFTITLTFWHRSFTFNSNKSPISCTNFPVYYPDVYLQLNMFLTFSPHHQELNDCSGSLWFYLRIVVTAVLCSWSGRPAGLTTNTTRLSPRYGGKTRGCHCSHWAPNYEREDARNMLSCK